MDDLKKAICLAIQEIPIGCEVKIVLKSGGFETRLVTTDGICADVSKSTLADEIAALIELAKRIQG